MYTIAQIIDAQEQRNQMYRDLCQDNRRLANLQRHDALQFTAHPERGLRSSSNEEQDVIDGWAEYRRFCERVAAMQRCQ